MRIRGVMWASVFYIRNIYENETVNLYYGDNDVLRSFAIRARQYECL